MTSKSRRTVMVFGTFDGLHAGHRSLFRQSRRYGDALIVVVARDASVRKEKGRAPLYPLRQRMGAVRKSVFVDRVLQGDAHSRIKTFPVIRRVNPDIICVGYDQRHYLDMLSRAMRRWRKMPRIVRLKAYRPQKYKSSLMRNPKL